ncbi:MAG: HU family DNA-binding protein [Sedimenticola sp.]
MAVKKKTAKKTAKKAAVRKAPATKKKVVAKKKTAAKKKAPAKAAPAKLKSIGTKQTKLQIMQAIAEETGLTRKQVGEVFGSLGDLIQRHMQRRGSGEFAIPETGVKIRRVKKPARKARMGRNPATGEAIKIAAKPASTVIKVTALKALKDTLS